MRQPVSRNSFDRLHGYLGVHLQEGAPLVDANWNEAVDVQWSLLRDAIRDAGLDGTSGIELRIDPVDGGGLVARGGPGRFYCNGLPVLWPASRLLEVDGLAWPTEGNHRGEGDGEGDGEPPSRTIFLEAWVGVVDSLDLPDLDDPGLGAERGTFRTVVHSRIRVGAVREHRTNLELTVRGTYSADRNALYRVELLDVRDDGAALLWDSAAASVTALVTDRAEAGAMEVALGTTDGFEVGNFVRFEGKAIHQRHAHHGLYRVTGKSAGKIAIEGHDCIKVSLVDCTGISCRADGAVLEVIIEDNRRCAPLAQLCAGAVVKDLPANLGKVSPAGGWRVLEVKRACGTGSEHPGEAATVRLRLGPNGLVAPLDPWNHPHATPLALRAHPFQTCIEVQWPDDPDAQAEWTPGMQVLIGVDPATELPETALQFVDTESSAQCQPGAATVQMAEIRRVARIIHHRRSEHGEPLGPTMTLILADPLSSEHTRGTPVVPARPIRARRYEGHACTVPIDIIDPASEPSPEDPTSPYDLGGRQPLVPTGLSLLLSVEKREGETTAPRADPGDGWTFAARTGGWVERPIFAPVDEIQRGAVPLAEVRWDDEGALELIDLRPVPAPHAHHGWLADIADTADELALSVPIERADRVAEIARRAGGTRAQRALVPELSLLVDDLSDWASASPTRGRARELLRKAVDAVQDAESPTAHELSRIGSAMERLSCAAAAGGDSGRTQPDAPAPPEPDAPAPTQPDEPAPTDPDAPAPTQPDEPAPTQPDEPAPTEPDEPAPTQPDEPAPTDPDQPAPAPTEPDPPAPVPAVVAPDGLLDIAGLPTRLVQSSRTITSSQRRKWPTLRDVPAPATLARGQERRLAEAVATLLDQTADIGRRALAGEDRIALQAALDAVWKTGFDLDKLPRTIHLEDAIALGDRPQARGAKP